MLRGDEEVRPCHAYRDRRIETVIPAVHEKIAFESWEAMGVDTTGIDQAAYRKVASVDVFKALFRKIM